MVVGKHQSFTPVYADRLPLPAPPHTINPSSTGVWASPPLPPSDPFFTHPHPHPHQVNVDAAAAVGIDALLFRGVPDLEAQLRARGLHF